MATKNNSPKDPSRKKLAERLAECQEYWGKAAQNETGLKKKLLTFAAGPAALPVAAVVVALVVLSLVGGIVLLAGGSSAPASSTGAPAASGEWVEPEEDKKYDASQGIIDVDVYQGTVLPVTADAGQEYVDGTLFLGDSNTVRYMMYGKTTLKNDIGVVSMGAGAIATLGCVDFQGYTSYVTMPEAVAIMQPERVIITFGTNNLSGSSTDASKFIETYQKGLQAIVDAYPSVDLIVNSIPPLDKLRENTNLHQSQIDAYNKAIVKMCEKNGWKYLNSAEALKDEETGWAKTDYTLGDGVHLSQKGVDALFEYVRTHAYITEDDRPKPLKPVPERNETPVGLITSDPIAVRGAKVPIEFRAAEGGYLEGETSQSVKKTVSCSPVKAVANEGWKFSHWEASLGSVGTSSTLVFVVPQDADANGVVLTAHFEERDGDPTPTRTPTPSRTPFPSGTITPTPSISLTPTVTPSVTVTPTVTGTATPTPTTGATATPTPTTAPVETPTPVPATPTEAPPEPTPEPTPESTPEPTPESTPEPEPEPTEAPSGDEGGGEGGESGGGEGGEG